MASRGSLHQRGLSPNRACREKHPLVLWGEDLPSRGMPGAAEATGLGGGQGGMGRCVRGEWGRGAGWREGGSVGKGGEWSLRRLRGLELKSASDAPPCGSSEKGKEGI